MIVKVKSGTKAFASLLILAFFIWGVGKSPFFPSLRLLQDTQWDFSLFLPSLIKKILALLWLFPVSLGFWGWASSLKTLFFKKIEPGTAHLLGMAVSLGFFSLYVFGLAINEILYWYLTLIFFLPMVLMGWREYIAHPFSYKRHKSSPWALAAFGIPLLLWTFEYLSPPIVWDAVLDHFRYAREVSRLHQILFHWTNHTGDMPKAAELLLAGFWNLGGETLAKFSSSIPALLTIWLFFLFSREWKGNGKIAGWIFWTCPFFLALFSWGYVEGFLSFFEVLAVFCFWRTLQERKNRVWLPMTAFFLGMAFAIKYTALLAIAALGLIFIYEKFIRKNPLRLNLACFLLFALPLFPWLFKNWLAFGNPFYPLATSFFGSSVGYTAQMEGHLLEDTGAPNGNPLVQIPLLIWRCFFSSNNSVGAAWTPLVAMSLPWIWKSLKSRLGLYLSLFAVLFLLGWAFYCTSLRHASGGAVVLILLSAMAWNEALREKVIWPKVIFGLGSVLSLWLCLSAQLNATAPYAAALGFENPLLRLKRHYNYSTDTYTAYQFIEDHSDSRDKVMAFGVFQTYLLQRTAFVDFKWKKPIFLDWASHCQTAEQLAQKLREEGVRYFLYQQWEAEAMSKVEKDFDLTGIPVPEYVRFWRYFMEPIFLSENSHVYRVLEKPSVTPMNLSCLPGIQEKQERF